MAPIAFVAFQLLVVGRTFLVHVRRDASPLYRLCWLASVCGVIGLDVWYFSNFAYPGGFAF